MLKAKLPIMDIQTKKIHPGFFCSVLAMRNAKNASSKKASVIKIKANPLLIPTSNTFLSINAKYKKGQLIHKKPNSANIRNIGRRSLYFSTEQESLLGSLFDLGIQLSF